MRRDYFTLQVRHAAWIDDETAEPALPKLRITYEGPVTPLAELLRHPDGRITAEELDVTYRLQDPLEDPEAVGVLSLTNRQTGEYILEVNAPASTIVPFLRAARDYGTTIAETDGRFRIELDIGDDRHTFDKRSLLVYNADGSLLRQHSLIPSGVEL